VLYQAAVTTDLVKGTSQMSHYYVPVHGPKHQAWRDGGKSPRGFSLETLVGNTETTAMRMVMMHGTAQMDLIRAYVYKRSEINRYYDPQKGQTDAVLESRAGRLHQRRVRQRPRAQNEEAARGAAAFASLIVVCRPAAANTPFVFRLAHRGD
jgi:hypothetical protein